MTMNTCKIWSNGIKIALLPKKYKKSPCGWGFCPQTPVCDTFELQYTSLLKHVSKFRHYCILTIGLRPLLERIPSYVPAPDHSLWSFILRHLCPHKKFFFEVSGDVIVYDLGLPQPKNLTTPMHSFNKIMVGPTVKPRKSEVLPTYFFHKNLKFWVEAGCSSIFTNFQPHLLLTFLENKLHKLSFSGKNFVSYYKVMLTLRQLNNGNTKKIAKLCWFLTKMLYKTFYYLAPSASLVF